MATLAELAQQYRVAKSLDERVRIAGEIVCEIGPELEAFALRRCRPAIAEEIYQETLIVIAKNLRQFHGDSDGEFRSWCFTILRRKLIDYIRKEHSDRFEELNHEEAWRIIEAGNPEIPPGVKLDLDYALNLIDSLKPLCAALLWVHHILGWDVKLIAEVYEMTYDAARMQLNRCLDFAESLMAKHA